jgi:uncharacterized protein
MAFQYQTPGVYIKEEDLGPKPVQPLSTAMPAFLGITREASRKKIDPKTGEQTIENKKKVVEESYLRKPVPVTSWTQFVDVFGDFADNIYLPDAVYGYFANGGGPCYVVSLQTTEELETPRDVADPQANLGAPQPTTKRKGEKVEKQGGGGELPAANTDQTMAELKPENLPAADTTQGGGDGGGSEKQVAQQPEGPSMKDLDNALHDLEPLDQIRLILYPDLMARYRNAKDPKATKEANEFVKAAQQKIIDKCDLMKYWFAVLDTPPNLDHAGALEWKNGLQKASNRAALYYPWIKVSDLTGKGKGGLTKDVPPCGHMVGIYNRSDSERGVHKAPANEEIRGIVGLVRNLSKGDQDMLNLEGVNCLRAFPGRGIRVWGARTLASASSGGNVTWQYINVRRLFIMVESSIEASLQWVVFEPNDTNLWARVTRDISAFLRDVWRSGALFGTTPSQAFYVKCDEELNPSTLRDLGQLHIEIGLAPTKPAEFVVVHITQWAGLNAEAG